MIKKLIAVFAVAAVAVAGIACYVLYGFPGADTAVVSASETDKTVINTASACAAVDRMTSLCCGTVSGSDCSMEASAFHSDFVPREPAYVERFRHYDGPKADFVPVLMYHFFYDAATQKPTKGANSHAIQSVREQLKWLWDNDYVTLTMDELYEWLNERIEVPAKCVVLTSDDGQDNFFDLLQPELHKYGFVATSFVITSWRKNLPYKLTLPNVELHSHTHNMHRGTIQSGGIPDNRGMMQGVSVEEGVKDLLKSQEVLGGSRYFAYPYGTYGGNSKEILREAGFRLAFTTKSGVVRRGDDPLQLSRLRVAGSLFNPGFSYLVKYSEVAEKYQ